MPADSAQVAMVAIKVTESPRHQYALDRIIGEDRVGENIFFLAKWVGTDRTSYEPSTFFDDSTIQDWYEERACLRVIDNYYNDTLPKIQPMPRPQRDASRFMSHDYTDLETHRAETAKLLEDVSGPIRDEPMAEPVDEATLMLEELAESEAYKYV